MRCCSTGAEESNVEPYLPAAARWLAIMEEEGNGIGRRLGCLHGVATLFAPLSFPFLRLPIRLGPKVEVERSSRVEDRHRLVEESDHPMDR